MRVGSEDMAKSCDVIIGGGGMVGLTLALALAKSGMKVASATRCRKARRSR
jgi:glycine/D-amino acid oxidase-like deaminating enzyme